MKTTLKLFKKEWKLFLVDKIGLALTYGVPVVLILIFAQVFGGGSSSPSGIRLVFINNSNSEIGKKLEKTLDTMKAFRLVRTFKEDGKVKQFDTNSAKKYIRAGNATTALIIPEDAYTDSSLGLKLKIFYDPKNDLEIQLVQGLLQKTIMENLAPIFTNGMWKRSEKFLGKDSGSIFNKEMANIISKYFDVDAEEIMNADLNNFASDSAGSSGGMGDFFEDILQIDKQQLVGEKVVNPSTTRLIGGWAIMFLLFSITAASTSLFDEKKNGLIIRLLSAPISKKEILWSKYLFNMSIGISQILLLFFIGSVFYSVDIYSNFINLLLMIIAASMACTGFGMLLASLSKTAAQANGWGTFLIITMSAIGGAWFPTFFMPEYIQILSKLTFVYWSVEGFLMVLWRNGGLIDILPHLGFLLGLSVVINVVSYLRFQKGDVLN